MQHAEFNLVVLISGNGSNLQAIIDAIQAQTLPVSLRAVISDRPGAFGLARAAEARIPAHVVDYRQFPQREDFDKALMQQIDAYSPDLVVLAGFMRILTTDFVEHYLGKMINVHPSLLPKYQGLNTHQRVLDAGEQIHGASVHYVTPELDSGPLILQGEVPVFPDESAKSLQQRVHAIEHKILPAAIRLIATGQVTFRKHRVYYGDKPMEKFQLDALAKQL
ncbi:MAG: phosphoribosylglycinamide formyltransferase [Gammaproteobacteria bacterium]|nr:phosphoribosylglycinamide formyltransferase [Gammaproteobacteria bacterium]